MHIHLHAAIHLCNDIYMYIRMSSVALFHPGFRCVLLLICPRLPTPPWETLIRVPFEGHVKYTKPIVSQDYLFRL